MLGFFTGGMGGPTGGGNEVSGLQVVTEMWGPSTVLLTRAPHC